MRASPRLLALLTASGLAGAGCRHVPPAGAPAAAASAAPAAEVSSAPASAPAPVRRSTGRPAAEALTRLLQTAGRTVEVAEVRSALQDLERELVPLEEAVAVVARRQDLWVHAQYGGPARLRERLAAGVPVLVEFLPPPDRPGGSFAVVTAYHPNRQMFRVLNARGQAVDQPEPDLMRDWAPTHYWMMTACRPERGRWNLTPLEHLSRMQVQDAAGRYERGDADAAQALIKDGRNPELCVVLGARARARGRPEEAEILWRRALERDPEHVRAANNLAYLLAEQGRALPEAEGLARAAARREPTNPRVLHTVGFVLQARQREAESVPWLERAWNQSVAQPPAVRRDIGLHLAEVYAGLGRTEDAVKLLRSLRAEEPGLLLPPGLAGLLP